MLEFVSGLHVCSEDFPPFFSGYFFYVVSGFWPCKSLALEFGDGYVPFGFVDFAVEKEVLAIVLPHRIRISRSRIFLSGVDIFETPRGP